MEASPKIVTVSEDNNRYKKRSSFRDKGLIIKAFLIAGSLLALILVGVAYIY